MAVLAMAGLLYGPGAAAAQQADFTGTWVLDTSRSKGVPEDLEQTMTVTHKGDRLEIETRMAGPQGDQTVSDSYVVNGQEQDITPALASGGTATGKRSTQWLADRRGFEATEQASASQDGETMTFDVTRTWILDPDGKTLTIEMTMKGPQGELTSFRVFART